jgi:HAD superfamily hydrolase (TIGR01509 family)
MPSNPVVCLVIFDFDGVLVDTQQAVNTFEWEYLSQEGLNISSEEFAKRFSGETAASIVERLRTDDNMRLLKDTQQLAKEIDEKVFVALSQQKIEPFKGVRELLSALKLKKCIASNCSERILYALLSASGLASFFDGNVFSADRVERPKPFPDLFLYAAHSMGVDPEHCLVIEDSEVGVKAAVSAGMRVFGFSSGRHVDAAMKNRLLSIGAERVFTTMDELHTLLISEEKRVQEEGFTVGPE